jgi:Nucleotidyl transferase AbiEii toxin, Type IV TA system
MVFKGGTSLSKIYGAIHRFSEDLDITIDYREAHDPIADPFSSEVSNTQRRAFSERMRVFTAETLASRILPKLQALATNLPVRAIRLNEAQDTITLEYESAFGSGYLLPQLKLEFGSRNAIEPNQIALVQPDLLAWAPAHDLLYPRAHVPVLLAERTYWEKVTLIHAENTRKNAKANTDRYSRHWYDLAMLAQHEIGARALQRTDLLVQVIHVKSLLFAVSGVNYQEVATGACKLVPSDALHDGLERDYLEMINAGMFDGMPPTWGELMDTLGNLEQRINALGQTNFGGQ